ncbi:hypothetical protein [uncultured Bacteroides sp.]|uniref:hypothetical protein n=1 Tax=uncultured Bacteroides sp. TaxID=162156 RepID=UPI002602D123|nr:hypothetical protein [uncultured Bacteroides sp.]
MLVDCVSMLCFSVTTSVEHVLYICGSAIPQLWNTCFTMVEQLLHICGRTIM